MRLRGSRPGLAVRGNSEGGSSLGEESGCVLYVTGRSAGTQTPGAHSETGKGRGGARNPMGSRGLPKKL
jgi:hypothetical protein